MMSSSSTLSGGSVDHGDATAQVVKKTGFDRVTRTRAIRYFRKLSIIFLVGSTVTLASTLFVYNRNREVQEFNIQFTAYANKVADSFRFHAQRRLLSLDAFSIAITSYARSANLEWPLVTVPDFAVRGRTTRQQAGAETLGFLPIVSKESREAWEEYAVKHQGWIKEAQAWEKEMAESASSTSSTRSLRGADSNEAESIRGNLFHDTIVLNGRDIQSTPRKLATDADFSGGVSSKIYTISSSGLPIVDGGSGPFVPIWQTSPAPSKLTTVNFNLLSHSVFWKAIEEVMQSKEAVIGEVLNLGRDHDSFTGVEQEHFAQEPISALYYPVFDNFHDNSTMVGILASELDWTYFFEGVLPDNAHGIICVIENACNQKFTFRIDGQAVMYLGSGDLHDPAFDRMVESRSISYLSSFDEASAGVRINFEYCPFMLSVYPSKDTQDDYQSSAPAISAIFVVSLFLIAAGIFFGYEKAIRRSQKGDMNSVLVLERLFPQEEVRPTLRKRILTRLRRKKRSGLPKIGTAPPHFRTTLGSLPIGHGKKGVDPFSNATVMFADIVGLESWSSSKKPEEKEAFLETVHRSLNVIAKRHGIFQVEMAGDCYVAVNGVQDAEDEHAVIMAHFTSDCRIRMIELFKSIQVKGLSMRFGLHSGHVQAGLYENDNARFQLFGDTVDTTYQMLTSGKPNKIHVSVETAELINLAGKSEWIAPRKDLVLVKGKGEMSTFWIKPKACLSVGDPLRADAETDTSTVSDSSFEDMESWGGANAGLQKGGTQFQNLVDWNFNVLLEYLKRVHARRARRAVPKKTKNPEEDIGMGDPIIEEALEIVRIPAFDPKSVKANTDDNSIDLGPDVEAQLRLYVSSIASTYRDNPFHNFEHATHVTMAMDRMLKRVATAEEPDPYEEPDAKQKNAKAVALDTHNRTFGIASDPLSQFALVFASLVHDVDQVGVSNYQLIKEKSPIAGLYKSRSVAEQNSVDIAWWLLMTPNFVDLRACIYTDAQELRRFRQLLVNSVIATDILDRDLKVHRDKGWAKAFRKGSQESVTEASNNLRATVVAEHLMQAADVAHTMQNFHTYLQWNEKLFEETYKAHHAGRSDNDPSETWYVGELCFFDNFVLPLATRLRDSGVFGRTGNDFLKYAQENRKQWADQGIDIVRDMVDSFSRRVAASQEETINFT